MVKRPVPHALFAMFHPRRAATIPVRVFAVAGQAGRPADSLFEQRIGASAAAHCAAAPAMRLVTYLFAIASSNGRARRMLKLCPEGPLGVRIKNGWAGEG